MQSILARPTTATTSGSTNGQRAPRSKRSFLSLKKGKNRSPTLDSRSPDSPLSPSSNKQSYLDAHSRSSAKANHRQAKSKTRQRRRTSSSSRSDSSYREESPPSDSRWEEDSVVDAATLEPSLTFPNLNFVEPVEDVTSVVTNSPLRPVINPQPSQSAKPRYTDSSIPALRFSGSSSQCQTETPPHTPVSLRGSLEYPSVVAPIAGVETMDALVDGMNGIGGDDFFGGELSSRSRFAIPGHHPLYQPPLPTPPPGVVLGGAKARKPPASPRSSPSGDDEDDDEPPKVVLTPRHRRLQPSRPSSSRTLTNTNARISPTPSPPPLSSRSFLEDRNPTPPHSLYDTPHKLATVRSKTLPPSISEIIRTHAPASAQVRSRPPTGRSSSYSHSITHPTVQEEQESEPEPLNPEEEAEMLSRSSVDSIADEVRQTILNQSSSQVTQPRLQTPSYSYRVSISDSISTRSPRSEVGHEPSIYSSSAASSQPPDSPIESPSLMAMMRSTPSQAVAQYLRSSRLTTLLKLTRSPHASFDNPLTVSLSDLGDRSGFPLVVFLGLGCVRQVMGLYDEMAECLGLRLITIDRWGLGRTEARSKSSRGIIEWAAVVEEVLDLLKISQCSVIAHSAGAPYALSFANRVPERIRGDICLLAPWVGGSESGGGYKWLKYVPNGILKTAQAAEWKIQAWMIGKPPTIAYEGIGHIASSPSPSKSTSRKVFSRANTNTLTVNFPNRRRPSIESNTFSEYDDLGDFDGRFESRSTLGATSAVIRGADGWEGETKKLSNKRKASKGFLGRLKGGTAVSQSQSSSPIGEKPLPPSTGRRLKALRSMGSLKGRSSVSSTISRASDIPPSPQLPEPCPIEIGLGFDDVDWTKSIASEPASTPNPRAGGRRSISFTTSTSPPSMRSAPTSPIPSTFSSPYANHASGSSYQTTLGNALIAASHAESVNGLHSDLMQILNHENHPWGFSYSVYPHNVRVWYGDKDEKIAENAVRWMERNMGEDRCRVKVVIGADHGLMYKSAVVVEVLERVREYWRDDN